MKINEQFETLLAENPQCLALALADMSSGTVLFTVSRKKQPQERLDDLCAVAADLLGGDLGQEMLDAMPSSGTAPARDVLIAGTEEQCLLLRLPDSPDEVLLAICKVGMDAAAFANMCRAALVDTTESPLSSTVVPPDRNQVNE